MKLKVKFLNWSAGLSVAMLNKETAIEMGVHEQGMILIKTLSRYPKESSAVIDTIEKGPVKKNEILVSSEIRKHMGLKRGQIVDVNIAPVPESLNLIKKKLHNKRLNAKEIDSIIRDIVNNSLSEAEVALFVSAMYLKKMTLKETVYLINAIMKYGNRLSIKNPLSVDKHSVGGVAGNRTTPIVVSICAAAGLVFPKTSSRAITSAAGTADVMETIARVDFNVAELRKILSRTKAFIVWGGSLGLTPADSKIIKVEKMLNIDPKSQLLASIMAKKFAVGSRYILIDIPYGKTAKVDKRKALVLKRKFEELGKYFHKKIKVVLTDGSQPIGNGVGPALEIADIIKILNPKEKGPSDLEKKSLFLAGEILEMTGKAKSGKGIETAKKILYSGKAFEKFLAIVKAQDGSLKKLRNAKFRRSIIAKKTGKIKEIDNKKISIMARITGCPVDKFSGLYLHYHVGEEIKKGKKVITIYAETKTRILQAVKYYRKEKPIKYH
ncbi:MAG: thymidine phosphorylase [archaeon]